VIAIGTVALSFETWPTIPPWKNMRGHMLASRGLRKLHFLA
jgi:hypothetical protein